MTGRLERALMVATPVVAMATVAVGLRVGAGSKVRVAVVRAAPASHAGTGLAWQVVVFDDHAGAREPVPAAPLDVVAHAGGREARWHGATDSDGIAEVALAIPPDGVHLEVSNEGRVIASGDASPPPPSLARPPQRSSAWASFARREGDVRLDVAVLGQRTPADFPASLWVKATDAKTHAPLAGVVVTPEPDPSFVPARAASTTDARGWTHVTASALGSAVTVVLHAKAAGGRAGEWAGALWTSVGASELVMRDRYAPGEAPSIEIVAPSVQRTMVVEIDDAHGRAWGAVARLAGGASQAPRAAVQAPPLAPGLYWAVVADDPAGTEAMGQGSSARPFFVAASDEAALAFGTDATECLPPADPRDAPRAVSQCLALVVPAPVPRWTALDGAVGQRQRDARRRSRGLAIALGALLVAVVLEVILVLRAAALARAGLRGVERSDEAGGARLVGRASTVAVGVLLALLGFALLAAFVVRAG